MRARRRNKFKVGRVCACASGAKAEEDAQRNWNIKKNGSDRRSDSVKLDKPLQGLPLSSTGAGRRSLRARKREQGERERERERKTKKQKAKKNENRSSEW
jgi:hypothetical protein